MPISELQFIGLSGHLESNAPGHFETFHKGLWDGVSAVLGGSNSRFIGVWKSNDKDCWFDPLIPSSMTSTIPWLPKRFLKQLDEYTRKSEELNILYVYEGNLPILFLLGSFTRKRKNVFLYFNFFDSNKYMSILNSRYKCILFKLLLVLASRGKNQKIALVADTEKFANLLTSKLDKNFLTFPMYSAFDPSHLLYKKREVCLINLRGAKSESLLKSIFEYYPEMQNIEFEIHGIHNEETARFLKKFSNIKLLMNQVNYTAYLMSYNKYKRVAFIYDPGFFSMQSSGRLADAIVAGTEIVVPKGTSLEDALLEYGNGSWFDFENEKSLVTALLQGPILPKKVDYLPTNIRAATKILDAMKSLISNSSNVQESRKKMIANHFIDELIWLVIGSLRCLFGTRRQIRKVLGFNR